MSMPAPPPQPPPPGMVVCPQGHLAPAGAQFCATCGQPVPGMCRNGHLLASNQPFCAHCGAPRLTSPGVRRQRAYTAPPAKSPGRFIAGLAVMAIGFVVVQWVWERWVPWHEALFLRYGGSPKQLVALVIAVIVVALATVLAGRLSWAWLLVTTGVFVLGAPVLYALIPALTFDGPGGFSSYNSFWTDWNQGI